MPIATPRDDLALDRVWAVPVLVAASVACLTARDLPVVLALVAAALVPWALGVVGRPLPGWLFGVLGVLPVAGVLAVEGVNAGLFLGTTTLSLLASRSHRPWHLAVLVVLGVVLPFVPVATGWDFDPGAFYFAIGDLFGIAVGLLLARARRLGEELRAADARLAAAAVHAERTRLARDVHDLVAHSLTVVVLQVGGARRVLRADTAAAENALEQAERVCRESLDGIREVVGLLRTGDEEPSAPLDLGRLVETYRQASVDVDFHADDDVGGLSLLVRGTLYRVVQEALANAARYRVPGTVVAVEVLVDTHDVTARVTNVRSSTPRSAAGGHGLTGLREQVGAVGGTLESGPVGGHWSVGCRIARNASAVRTDPVVG